MATAATDTPIVQGLIEVFSSDLPSQCNIYLSGKRSAVTRHTRAHAKRGQKNAPSLPFPLVRFATERHSLTLSHLEFFSEKGAGCGGGGRGDDEHSLFVAALPLSLPSSPSSPSSSEKDRKSSAKQLTVIKKSEEIENDIICLAHSSVFWKDSPQLDIGENDNNQYCADSSLEVFALARITPSSSTAETDTKDQKSSSDSNSLITHGSHSLSDGGKDGGESIIAESKSVGATSAVGSMKKNDSGMGDARKSNAKQNPLFPNYHMTVRSKILIENILHPEKKEQNANDHFGDGGIEHGAPAKPKIKAHLETISLDFRPMLIQATELCISNNSTRNDMSSIHSFCSAIGVFISSVDDNKLRLYVTTKDALQNNAGDSCFVPVSFGASSSVPGAQCQDDKLNDDRFLFSTPIMAMDACVTADEDGRSGTLHDSDVDGEHLSRVNRIAVACYDGTVRILTYRLEKQNPNDDNLKETSDNVHFSLVRCSSFIVDGPIVSLHFGIKSPVPASQKSHLFLVVGSVCGFVCVFYETSLPSTSMNPGTQDGSTFYFDGPLTVVDGLYDAQREICGDCVTSVHVVCCAAGSQPMIIVGTQGGRILMFRPYQSEEECALNESKDREIIVQQKEEKLASIIDQSQIQISQLESKKESMTRNATVLKEVISDMESKIGELETTGLHSSNADSLQLSSSSETCNTDHSVGEDGAEDEGGLDKPTMAMRDKEEVGPITDDEADMSGIETKLRLSRTELNLLEQSISDLNSSIAELEDLIRKRSCIQPTNLPGNYSICAGNVTRKMHRYKFLCEYHLPYPIHGIASSHHARGDGGRDIYVSTGRSFHVLRIFSFGISNAILSNRRVELLEGNLSKLLNVQDSMHK